MYAVLQSIYLWSIGLPLQTTLAAPPSVEPPTVQSERDIIGLYTLTGKDDNETYKGLCVIERKRDIYLLQYLVGGTATVGLGLRQGDYLAVAWPSITEDGKLKKAVTLYRIQGKSLVGRWTTLPGNGYLKEERLTFLKELPEEQD